MATYPVRTRRWTRAEYDRLIGIGVFAPDEPLELLGGELIVSEPQSSVHYTAIGLVEDALRAARRPVPDPSAPFGWRYASKEVLSAESSVELLEVPGARIPVSDLLP